MFEIFYISLMLNSEQNPEECDACLPAGRQQTILVALQPGSKSLCITPEKTLPYK